MEKSEKTSDKSGRVMSNAIELIEFLKNCSLTELTTKFTSSYNFEENFKEMGFKARHDLARQIIEMKGKYPNVIEMCMLKDSNNIIGKFLYGFCSFMQK